jgi:hypothetical protein
MKFNAIALAIVTWLPSALAAGNGNDNGNGSVRPQVINPYKKAPAAAPTAAAGGRNNTSTKPASKRQKINEFDGRSKRTKDNHKGAVKKWDQFASINGYSPFYGLTRQQVCGNVYANGSMANPENPPLRKMFAEFAQYLIEYKKTGKEDDDEEEEILADDGDDEEDDEEEGDWEEEIETAREPYNGLQPKVILQYFTTMKAQFFSRFEPLAFKGPSPTWYTRLHASLKLRVAANCLVRGGKMTKKAVGSVWELRWDG